MKARKLIDEILENPRFIDKTEALEIVCHVAKRPKSDLILSDNFNLSESQSEKIRKIAALREKGIPLAYCMGAAYFYDREFLVNPNVLIPRFDTEILIETVLKNESADEKFVLELGTGSGIIGEILQSERPSWNIISVDISINALSVARKNCQEKILLVNCDKFAAISQKNNFDFIVSNPPYIESKTIETLDGSVKDFEPKIALDGGESGLAFYGYLAENAGFFLKPEGRIYLEIGFNQGESVPDIFKKTAFNKTQIIKDLGQNPRVLRTSS